MKNSRWRFPIVLFAVNIFLTILSPAQNYTSSANSALTKDSLRLARTIQEYWEYPLTDTFYARYLAGEPLNDLPDISEAKAKSDAAFAKRILQKLHTVNQTKLSHDDVLTLEVLRWQAELEQEFAKYYWFDFQITPHASPLPLVQRILERRQFHTKEDLDSYLRLLEQLKVFIVQTLVQAAGQMQRGIVLPKAGIPGAKAFLTSYLKEEDKSPFFVAQERLKAIDPALAGPFQEKIRNMIQAEINPELHALVDYVGGDYARKALDAVGMRQYPGGKQYYRFMVRAYTTLEISPEELYRIGVESVEHDEAQMTELLSRIGFKGTRKEFREFLLTDPRFIAKKPEEIQERLMSYVRRIEPNIASYFLHVPKAGYTIRRLDPELEGAYAFGFYVEPSAGQPLGIFFFNGSQLNERSMLGQDRSSCMNWCRDIIFN